MVEPGLFRTNFLDESAYVASENVIDAYRDTVGYMRNGASQMHGNQPGDPKKLAQVFIRLANSENPPLHLPLGKDALEFYRDKTAKLNREIEEWKDIILSTDILQKSK